MSRQNRSGAADGKEDAEMTQEPVKHPRAECLLHMETERHKDAMSLARELGRLSSAVTELAKSNQQQRNIIHGPNFDNGLMSRVAANEQQLVLLSTLPAELRATILKWGMALVAAQGAIHLSVVGFIWFLIKRGMGAE